VLVDNGYIVYGLNDGDGREMFGFPILGEDASWHRYNLRAFSTSTVHDGVIYMSVLTWRTDKGMHLLYGRTLYAVNMHEGKEIWNTISATGLAPNEFVLGAPSIWGDSVLFTSYKGMEARADIILNCADARTGKLKWRCFLASVPNTYSYDTGKYAHLVAIEGDFGVVCSEGGMIAAVDLRNGCLAWVGEYKPDVGRDMVDGTGNRVQLPYDSPRRWAFNYPIVVSRRVYIKPQDSQNLYCLDPLTGQVKWTLKAPDMSYLVGVDDGKVFIIEKGVTVVDAATGKRLQSTPALKSLPAGRPAFTKTDIYISTLQSLLKYDRQTNEISVVFNWADKDLTPGNLVVTEDALYVANSEQVAAFFGPALAERLTKKLEKSPKDALLLYQRGRALLADNSLEKALSDFETALPLAGETAKYHNLPVREMINDGLYLCYVAMVRRCGSEGKIEDALKYSELALKRASTDETRFEASAALGEALEKGGDEAAWQKAIGRYQEIILQSPGVFRKFDGHLEQSAAFYAACRIDAILKTHGRSVYAGTEAEAAKLLAAAGNADEALLNVYKRYPNSMAALEALFRLAKKFEESGNTPMAIAALNTISDRFPKEADSAPANAMLYSLALKSGDYASARKALQTLAAMPETAQMKIGDKTVPVLDFAREKAAELDATTSALPGTGKLRNSPAPSQTMKLCGEKNQRYDGYTKFMGIINAQGPRPGHMSDKFLTFNGEIVECWDTATGGRLWLNTTLTPSIGISVSVRNGKEVFVQSVLRDQATDGAKLQVGDTILSVGGKEVNSLASFNQAVASLKMGDKVEVVFVSNGENRKTTLQSGPFSGIAGTITGARFNRDGNLVLCIADASRRILTEGWHPLYGEGNIVFRCVDSKTGQTLWNKTVREQNNVKQGPFEYRISATGLLTYYVGDKAGWWIEALDSANGKTVARVPASPHLYGAVMAGATDVMGIEVAPMTCHVYDILTGREKYRLPVSLDLDRMPLLAGNMVAFMDDSLAETLRVLDLRDGRVLYKAEHVSQYKAGASEKYLAVATPEKGGVIFDFLTGQPVAIDGWQAVPATVVLGGDYLCVEGHDNEGRNVFMQVYDARTGKATQCRIDMDPRTGQRFAWTKILGEYVVACYPVVINNMNAYVVIVTEIASGKEIYRGESQNQTATVDATITDGKLCITNGDAVTIIR
jgi:outer membrane protein assembly factor BamB/tetratricopeptide (TPR) repeat protein